jgi:hypothetical protein
MTIKHWVNEVARSLAGSASPPLRTGQAFAERPAWSRPPDGEFRGEPKGHVHRDTTHDQRLNELRRAFGAGEPSSGEVLLIAALDDGLPWGNVTRAVALGVADHFDEAASRLPR